MNLKFLINIVIIILFITNINSSCSEKGNRTTMNNQKTQQYNSITAFELNKRLDFPDFTIQHTKHKKIKGPNNAKWERQTFYFTILGEHDNQEISWSTGVTRNTKFTVNDKEFELVMGSYQDPSSKEKAFKTLGINELMIIKPTRVKLSKKSIKTGDIVFRSIKKKNGIVFFNEYGTVEKTLLGLFVFDLKNTIKQPLNSWMKNGIENKIMVYRKTSADFQMNKMELIDGSFNYLFDSEELELVTKNF